MTLNRRWRDACHVTGHWLLGLIVTLCGMQVSCAFGQDGCEPAWQPNTFCPQGVQGTVSVSVWWDDGVDAALYVGGLFEQVRCESQLGNIARWDGDSWSSLGPGFNGQVHALAVYDDGDGERLYAGGAFTTSGGETVNGIARWNGQAWEALEGLAPGVQGTVRVLRTLDIGQGPELFVGGLFSSAGGVAAENIARWNGAEGWRALTGINGGSIQGTVVALAAYDSGTGPRLIAGGSFTFADGFVVNNIASFNGVQWSRLGNTLGQGFNDGVNALEVWDFGSGPVLFAGGFFSRVISLTVNGIARWNGSQWLAVNSPGAVGMGNGGVVHSLSVFDDGNGPALHASGQFAIAGGVTFNNIARWDGQIWSALEGTQGIGVQSSSQVRVHTITNIMIGGENALFAGGEFEVAGGLPAMNAAVYQDQEWFPPDDADGAALTGNLLTAEVFDDGRGEALYVGGRFGASGPAGLNNIARRTDSGWEALATATGSGLTGGQNIEVSVLRSMDLGDGPALYVGGRFTHAGGQEMPALVRWDGQQWSPVGPGTVWSADTRIGALEQFDDGSGMSLFATGAILTINGEIVNGIARWDGMEWSPLTGKFGTGVINGGINAMSVLDSSGGAVLVCAGTFSHAGGRPASRLATWDGYEWEPMSNPGPNDAVLTTAVFDDGRGPALYIGGSFSRVGNVNTGPVARFDGETWAPIGGTHIGWTPPLHVRSMAWLRDGQGDFLVVGGEFNRSTPTGVVSHIVRFDGENWKDMGTGGLSDLPTGPGTIAGVTGLVSGMWNGRPSVWAVGGFGRAGGVVSLNAALWVGCAPVDDCLVDLNDDGIIDFFDVIQFVAAVAAADPIADFNGDGIIDFFDVLAFVEAVSVGCA